MKQLCHWVILNSRRDENKSLTILLTKHQSTFHTSDQESGTQLMNVERQHQVPDFDPKRHVRIALEITKQEWSVLGRDDKDCPNVAASTNLELTVERITALLVIRLVALEAPSHKYANLSTSCICQTLLRLHDTSVFWPESITTKVINQLRSYVKAILRRYKDVPYHNFLHAYQVIKSTHSLMDLILQSKIIDPSPVSADKLRFEEDPLMHLALLFAALIHDVDHEGVPNHQLVLENHPLALQYNDQSIAEQRSLAIGFTELLHEKYENLRTIMFPFTFSGDGYRRFRGAVTNLVLATDISSPDRSAAVKKKWQMAFGEQATGNRLQQRVLLRKKKSPKNKSKDFLPESTLPLILKPPREHPRPNDRKKRIKERRDEQRQLKTKESLDSWMDFNTPSKHFPKDSVCSMNESSLSFWWFCPPAADNKAEDLDLLNNSSVDDSSSASKSRQVDNYVHDLSQDRSVEDEDKTQDLEARFVLFSRDAAQDVRNARNSDLQVSYHYPSSHASFQKSFLSSIEGYESQHLLSPTKISRLDRIVSRSNHNKSEARGTRTPLSRYKALNSNAGIAPVKSEVQPEDDLNKTPKPMSGRFSLRSLYSPPPTNGMNTKQVGKSDNDSSSKNTPKPNNAMMELQSMVSRFRTVDLMSSIATMDDRTAATADDSSLNFHSSSKLKFDPQHPLDDAVSPNEGSIRPDFLLQDVQEEETEEGQPKNEPEERTEAVENKQGAIDEELCTISLMEHILLVADVGHTLQNWYSMLKWSFRLSQEMKLAIATGRGCGISNQPEDEELRSWHTNQISFLEGYVLPLARRLEQTGFLPMTTVMLNPTRISRRPHHPNPDCRENVEVLDDRKEVQPSTFLSKAVIGNCHRWKEQGMEVLFEWRNKAAKNNVPPSQESTRSINGWQRDNGGDPWHALRGDLNTINDLKPTGMSMIHVDECCPSRG